MDGKTLRSQRLRRGMSRGQLAHEIGVDVDTLAAWEEGDVPIRCPHAIEQVLGQDESSVRRDLRLSRVEDERTIAAR